MNTVDYIRREFAAMHESIDSNLENVTEDLFNWPAPGTANTISATLLHFLDGEDFFINVVVQGKAKIWESGSWARKTGEPKAPSIGEDWSEYKHKHVALQPVLEYKAAIWAATDAYLAALTDADLDKKVSFAGQEASTAEMLQMAISHALGHNGEIAALKGVQGAKGLAF